MHQNKGKSIEVSYNLFIQKGYEKTSIQDILNELGLSKGAIYHYFNSKEEILYAVLKKEKEKANLYLENLVSQNKGIFKATLEVKKRRGKIGSACASITLLIAVILYIINVPILAIGLSVAGLLTLVINLVMLNYFNR